VKTTSWLGLALLLVPGCLLVQPLDDAKPAAGGAAGSGNSSGKPSHAGSAGHNNAGSGPAAGGSGNSAGASPVPPGGAPSSSGGGGEPPVEECVLPGDFCTESVSCCQTEEEAGPYGATCLADDFLCHSICLSNSECMSDCCVELDGTSYGACADPSYCGA